MNNFRKYSCTLDDMRLIREEAQPVEAEEQNLLEGRCFIFKEKGSEG
jgi:hypothetical protein